ncbi:MAG TPA: carbon-nitrogen hydrolase family protein [Oligoflexus sp.]|uniref:carbon-nitrogen hydrolase family protein n=1 Tax=Oligoflexus sp. TaxID=1971216 RepID=UPI002D741111|nr:carbon-nitrogen hydrolase family protein [Oligoflexus sp.]HYX38748.1 carbon-nitrogen hydrolase family protein [Oligoflexus sp.]
MTQTSGSNTRVRVAAINYRQERLASWSAFTEKVEEWTRLAAEYHCDFVCFPEFLSLQLLTLETPLIKGAAAIDHLMRYTEPLLALFKRLAQNYKINIIGGSHLQRDADGTCHNIAHVFTRQGQHFQQGKIHPTPSERDAWNVHGTSDVDVIATDCGPVAVLICYDSEFPELSRRAVDQGAKIIFVPFCTDDRQGYLRVRYCSQARAIENQCYMVLSGNVGLLPGVFNMGIQYGQSCILTPCDFGFARDGIASEAEPNTEGLIMAELRLDDLDRARTAGTVRNLADRRLDLYQVQWKDTRS